jgi:hypothetical protein
VKVYGKIKIAYRKLSINFHPDKSTIEGKFQEIQEFGALFDNLPLIYTIGDSQLRKSQKNKIVDYNEKFIKKNIADRNEDLKNLLDGNENKLNGLYSNYNSECKFLTITVDDELVDAQFPFSKKEFKEIAALYLDEISKESKSDYKQLFDNYEKLYKNCFKEDGASSNDGGVVSEETTDTSENTDIAEKAEKAKQEAEAKVAAEKAKQEAAEKFKETIANKGNLILLDKIDSLRVKDGEEYSEEIIDNVAETIHTHGTCMK